MKKFVVVPPDPNWARLFEEERKRLLSALGRVLSSVHHIGSTSISGIYAKPVIDILVEAKDIEKVDSHNSAMIKMGYEVMGEFGIPGRRYFRRDINGVRTFQIHIFQIGSDEIARHIAFRDYLAAHPGEARAYSDLKRQLVLLHDGDSHKYMDGKDEFVREIDRKAEVLRDQNLS